MRVLLDECLDERLRHSFSRVDCQTARYEGVAGLKNGQLLEAAEAGGFDVFITVDQGIEYQQDLAGRRNRRDHLASQIQSPLRSNLSRGRVPDSSDDNQTGSSRHNNYLSSKFGQLNQIRLFAQLFRMIFRSIVAYEVFTNSDSGPRTVLTSASSIPQTTSRRARRNPLTPLQSAVEHP